MLPTLRSKFYVGTAAGEPCGELIPGRRKGMKLFYTGPAINTEMLLVMLEKHGITATQEWQETEGDPEDLNRMARVLVPEADFDRAWRLFYAEREDEL